MQASEWCHFPPDFSTEGIKNFSQVSDRNTANVALIYFYKLHSIPYEGKNFSVLLLLQEKLQFILPAWYYLTGG